MVSVAIYVAVGIVLGALAAWVIFSRQQKKIQSDNVELTVALRSKSAEHDLLLQQLQERKSELQRITLAWQEAQQQAAAFKATVQAMQDKLDTQRSEIETLRKQFNTEFENIAAKILEEKSEKFTKLNQDNLSNLLNPLRDNLDAFKKKVEEVYNVESKERFSLGKEVEKLVLANQKISEEANNLTKALTSHSKTQGDWGQMILENILEKSGLMKDREYFIQEFLKDEDGNYLQNEEGRRLQPDIIVAYPDNRKIIVDSKVSLTAYTRYVAASSKEEQQAAISDHLRSIRQHVLDLSRKRYQDFAQSLDFVILFMPNEPAYFLALQQAPQLWQEAYEKRVLLISPTNLLATLKIIVDLWKREYQNQHAQAIADRGAALYDKLVGFVENLSEIGMNLEKAQKSYQLALGQLKDGRGNLISQAEKLKELGVKPKRSLPSAFTRQQDLINEDPIAGEPPVQ